MKSMNLSRGVLLRHLDELTSEETVAWDSLLTQNDLRRAFLSRHYVRQTAQAWGNADGFRGERNIFVLVIYKNQKPQAFLPLQQASGLRGIARIYEPVGGVMTDYFGIIAAEGIVIDIAACLAATRGQVNAIWFSHLDETQAKFGLHGQEPRPGLRTSLGTQTGEYWSNLKKQKKSLVYDTGRMEKKLGNEIGPLTFEWSSQSPEQDITWLIEEKKKQYLRTGKSNAPLFSQHNINLIRGLLQVQEDTCHGLLSVLRSGDRIIAAHFGLRCGDMLHIWFPVYDPELSGYSPGRVLFKHLFEAAPAAGVHMLDWGEGEAMYKQNFATESHLFFRGLWYVPGWRGYLARGALSVAWRLGLRE